MSIRQVANSEGAFGYAGRDAPKDTPTRPSLVATSD
jgi:hypothetical protein